ncbi:MAG: DUF167 domain-containing protein [Dehalococcoidia bacterium]
MEARIRVRVTPRAARDGIAGWQDGVLRVRVTAPPIAGKANDAVAALIAKALGVPKSAVGVAAGARGRDKTIAIANLAQDEVERRLREAGAS